MTRRVVVTGMGGLSPLGASWPEVRVALREGRSGVERMTGWDDVEGLETRLAAPVRGFETPAAWPRKKTRSMGRVSLLATRATELALADAGLLGSPIVSDGSTGVSYGSTSGSPAALEGFTMALFGRRSLRGVGATEFVRLMSHTCAANLGQFFEARGRIIPTCSACTAGSQGIGYAYEAVRFGRQAVMLGGGAEELHVVDAAVFDLMFATSKRNDEPTTTPRPFDASRDGLVVGEGAGTLVLEDLEHAEARGARIHAEVIGFATNCDGRHVTNPSADGMARVMEMALEDAGLAPEAVGYVSAHGTATEVGDIAESAATRRVLGERVPISSLKSFMGHTLGACGALEAWMTIQMMQEGWFAPTLHLAEVDPRCAPLDYIQGGARELEVDVVMSNNFAFGGVNTSLLFRRWPAP